jgi:hypothetical protein
MSPVVRTRTIGILLMALLVAALVQAVRLDRTLSQEREASASRDRSFASVELGVSHLRGAQAAYLATGQPPTTWFGRVTEYATRIEADLEQLRVTTPALASRPHYDAAFASLDEVTGIDARAREYVRTDQRYLASDLVFMDSVGYVDRLTSAVRSARAAELEVTRTRLAELGWMRLGLGAAAIAAGIGLGIMIARLRPATAAKPPATMAEMLKSLPPPVKPPAPVTAPATTTAVATPLPAVNLAEAADLCVDLARVADGRDVPALVERAAKVLDAKGMVLWTADSGGAVLRPSVTHGYPEKVLSRLGPLLVDADNVTALAYRSMRPQAMTSSVPGNSGALAIPLVTATGCVGVLAAEIKQNRSGSELMPVAKIIAAQFAALMTPADAAAPRSAQA